MFLASAPIREFQNVAAVFKRETSDGVTEAAEIKQCFAVDEKDFEPDVD